MSAVKIRLAIRRSPTPHGVGGLKSQPEGRAVGALCPTPHGVGGLKCGHGDTGRVLLGPTPHGVGGLKSAACGFGTHAGSPTPHGVGGLKCPRSIPDFPLHMSHPTRGGWMEITAGSGSHRPCISPSHRLGNRPSIVYSKNPCGVLHHRGHFLPISLQKSPSNAP